MRNSLNTLLTSILIILMSLMVVCTLLQVFARFVNLNVPFTEELTIYAMMWVTMFGSAYAFGIKKHIAIDVLITVIKDDVRWKLEIIIELLISLFAILIFIIGGGWFVLITFKLGQISPVIQIPKGWIYLAIPASGVIILMYNVLNIKAILTNKPLKV